LRPIRQGFHLTFFEDGGRPSEDLAAKKYKTFHPYRIGLKA